MTDDIQKEIRRVRDAFAEAHAFDVHAMGDAFRRLAAEDGRPVVRLSPRPVNEKLRRTASSLDVGRVGADQ